MSGAQTHLVGGDRWIGALDTLLAFDAPVAVPGHGPASNQARADLGLSPGHRARLRRTIGEAARSLGPFEDAQARTDGSRFDRLPMINAANRIDAHDTCLLMEQGAK